MIGRIVNVLSENTRFSDRIIKVLERVAYRRAESEQEKETIFRMRYDAYARDKSIAPRESGMFTDAYDGEPNTWFIAVEIDGELASSVRIHVSASPDVHLPVMKVFSDKIGPKLSAGHTVVDGSRFVTKPEFSRRFPELPYITLRSTSMAQEFFRADFMTAACRLEHQAFYMRMMMCDLWAELRPYPGMNWGTVLTVFESKLKLEKLFTRFPYFSSEPWERANLFSRSSNSIEDPFKIIGRVLA